MVRTLLIAASAVVLTGSAAAADRAPTAETRLAGLLDRTLADAADVPSISMTVLAPTHGVAWTGVTGRDGFEGPSVSAPHAFRIASVTKVFVAAAILRLVEQHRLDLTASIDGLVSSDTVAQLRRGGYDPGAIRLRHLLEHTAGIYDYAMSEPFQARVAAEPRHRWTRAEQIELAMQAGAPTGAPGERYAYSDTGYVILGEILERATGRPMAAAVRELNRFGALGLSHTWFETLEPAPRGAPPRFRQYWVRTEITEFDPSFDLYGGGGLVSTTPDLARYVRALLSGRVFDRPETLALALATPAVAHAPNQWPHAPLLPVVRVGAHQCWGHGGFFGTLVVYCPDLDAAVAVSVNANTAGRNLAQQRAVEGAIEVLDGTTRR